jgi:hypothetical protein
MRCLCLIFVALMPTWLLVAPSHAQVGCENSKGWKPTEAELRSILQDHERWFAEAKGRDDQAISGKANFCNADLSEAKLSGAKLSGANLSWADLSGAKLSGAILSGAILSGAKLSGANLSGANLSGAILLGAYLGGADLPGANLSGADLSETDLSEANLFKANLSGANLSGTNLSEASLTGINLGLARLSDVTFDRSDLRGANFASAHLDFSDSSKLKGIRLLGVEGLSMIRFDDARHVAELRSFAQKAGLRKQDRALTSALRKFALKAESAPNRFIEQWLLGGRLTDFGASPMNSLVLLLWLIPAFALIYSVPIATPPGAKPGDAGIYRIWPKGRIGKAGEQLQTADHEEVTHLSANGLFALGYALYFSALSAFHIGWRELKVGSWLTRLQSREYVLRARGWVRVVSGAQSLISIYMVAMWALTYFGRPFQ